MRLSRKCQYALRAVFDLAWRNSEQPVKVHEIAGSQNIPPRFLEVILNELRHGGFVDSRRGNEGGYMLARPAEGLTVGGIIEFMEGPISITGNPPRKAAGGEPLCGDCALNHLWKRVNSAVREVCDDTSFAELVEYEVAKKTAWVPNYAI